MKESHKHAKEEVVVFAGGTWDLFHVGHLNILKKAKKLGTKLIVGVSPDEVVKSYKKSFPIIPFNDRVEIIKSCQYVDEVVQQDRIFDINHVKKLGVNVFVIGDDWKNKTHEGLKALEEDPGIQLAYLPYTEKISSTILKNKLIKYINSERDEVVVPSFAKDLKNKNILITGASSGLGASMARLFAEAGANIGIHYSVNEVGATALADDLSELTKIKVYQCDFSTSKNINLIENFLNDFEHIDILVNNAGMIDSKSILDLDLEDYDHIFNVNSRAPFMLSKEAFKNMKNKKGGKIINISSFVTKYGMGRNNSIQYAATKSTLETLTTGLSRMGAEHNILVNAIRPGIIHTRMNAERENFEERVNMIPLKRAGHTEDIANLVLYLASNKGNFITGEVFTVSGGE